MEKHYARALWKMTAEAMKPKDAVAKLRAALAARGRESLLPKIGRAFARIAARESARRAVVISVAREKDAASAKLAASEVLRELGAESTDVEVRLDDTLIGGWRLEGRERVHDASYKQHLLKLFDTVTR